MFLDSNFIKLFVPHSFHFDRQKSNNDQLTHNRVEFNGTITAMKHQALSDVLHFVPVATFRLDVNTFTLYIAGGLCL